MDYKPPKILTVNMLVDCKKCSSPIVISKIVTEKEDSFSILKTLRVDESGTNVFHATCPNCGEPWDYPYDTDPKLFKDVESRVKTGLKYQKAFKNYWNLHFATKYGKLELKDVDPFESKADFYNETLKLHLEEKLKWRTWHFIEERGGDVWLNKTSLDHKNEQQKHNPNHIYSVVVYFPDKGWYVVKVTDVVKCRSTTPYHARGSGDKVYEVPQSIFKPFPSFIDSITT